MDVCHLGSDEDHAGYMLTMRVSYSSGTSMMDVRYTISFLGAAISLKGVSAHGAGDGRVDTL